MTGQNGQVAILAPSPQLTVTVEDLNGEPDIHVHAGGQGVWQTRMINSLGVPVVLCGTVGGETGHVLRHLLRSPDITLRLLDVDARNSAYVHDRRDGDRDELVEMPAGELARHDLDDLYELTLTHALEAGIALLSGPSDDRVLPHSLYRRLARDLSANGCQVLVDLAGQRLSHVLDGGPTFVKVSHEELLEDGRAASAEVPDLVKAIREIAEAGPSTVVVSRAADPALAMVDGDFFTLHVPDLSPVETRGGGDSMTAGVAASLALKEPMDLALRTGAAAGALNITRRGLGTGSGDAIRALVDRVELRTLKP